MTTPPAATPDAPRTEGSPAPGTVPERAAPALFGVGDAVLFLLGVYAAGLAGLGASLALVIGLAAWGFGRWIAPPRPRHHLPKTAALGILAGLLILCAVPAMLLGAFFLVGALDEPRDWEARRAEIRQEAADRPSFVRGFVGATADEAELERYVEERVRWEQNDRSRHQAMYWRRFGWLAGGGLVGLMVAALLERLRRRPIGVPARH
jgi:hypothetical protein